MSRKFHMGIFYFKPYPGNPIADELKSKGYVFSDSLEDWSNFDYVDSGKSEWISSSKIREIENFKFYQHIGWHQRVPGVVRKLAQWRVERKFYAFPFERKLKEWLRPSPELS
jgi:hypothetical protein